MDAAQKTDSRKFTLAHDVDESKADAKYSDGVLELTLPKKTVETDSISSAGSIEVRMRPIPAAD